MKLEAWKYVDGFEYLYGVSNLGRVYSNLYGGKILNGNVDGRGYRKVFLRKQGTVKRYAVHRLVANAFIANPEHYPCINHKDGNKLNNEAANLEWCSYKQNTNHAFRIGLMRGSSEPRPWKCKAVRQISSDGCAVVYESLTEAAKRTGIGITSIANCLSSRSKQAGGFRWNYLSKS